MSEPWAHPQRDDAPQGTSGDAPHPASGEVPQRTSVNAWQEDAEVGTSTEPHAQHTEQLSPAGSHAPQTEHLQPPGLGQPTEQYPHGLGPQYEQSTYEKPTYEQPVHAQPPYEQATYAHPTYEQPVYAQPAPLPRKKSGVLGLVGLLFVILGIVGFGAAIGIGVGSIELSEELLTDIGNVNTTASVVLLISVGVWLLGSLLCLIAICARRGTISGAIGLVLVLIPSWLLGATIMAAAAGSTMFINFIGV